MSRGLNKVQIIGRLGRDPEMRYTPQGSAVTTFSVATGGKWTDRNGTERDDTEWFRVEAWDQLAETCNQYLTKGMQVYIEGRLKTDKWVDREGLTRYTTKVRAGQMLMLDSKGGGTYQGDDYDEPEDLGSDDPAPATSPAPRAKNTQGGGRNQPQPVSDDDISEDDIPF